MELMKVNQIKVGTALSYAQMAVGIVIGLVYTPVMIRLLGKSEYGLYNTVSSAISMLAVLNLGFNSGYIRFFAKYKKEKDTGKIDSLNGLFLLIFAGIGVIALLCGLYLSSHLHLVFREGLTGEEYALARTLFLILTVNLAVSFPMSVFSNIISANERFVFLKLLSLIKTVVSPLVTLPLLLLGFRSVAMVVVTVALALLTDVLYLYYVLFVLRNRFVFRAADFGIFPELFAYTGLIAVNLIVDQVNWNIDKLLLARYQGTESVAIYSVGYTLYSYYMVFSTSVSGLFTPRVHKIIRDTEGEPDRQREALSSLFVKVGRVQLLLLGLLLSGIVFFGKTFITRYWAGADYGTSYVVCVLLSVSATVALIQNLGIEIQRAENRHWFRSIAYFCMAIINLFLSVFLCKRYGAVGCTVGTAVSLILCNGLLMNVYYHRKCNIDIKRFWKKISGILLGFSVPVGFGILLTWLWKGEGLFAFGTKILLYTAVYGISMWLLCMNTFEKSLVKKPLGILFARLRRKTDR